MTGKREVIGDDPFFSFYGAAFLMAHRSDPQWQIKLAIRDVVEQALDGGSHDVRFVDLSL